ncbi:MAG: TolC family protein, partial [Moraxella sp.]|nr:TolC family protein [Moraxella sp.]
LFKAGSSSWSFGPSINLPIFDAGARRANYEVSKLEQQQRLAAYEGAIQTAFREVNDVLAERATLDEQLKTQYKLQANYQRTYDIAYATFRSGLSSYLEVLDSERSLFSVQQSILQMELQKLLSQIALYQALGGGSDLTVEQITSASTQTAAMTPARIATANETKKAVSNNTPTPTKAAPKSGHASSVISK